MRLARARAFLAKGDPVGAMPDLNAILAARPDDAAALTMRGKAFSAQKEYPKALEDLNAAIARQETVEQYTARAAVYETQNQIDRATDPGSTRARRSTASPWWTASTGR